MFGSDSYSSYGFLFLCVWGAHFSCDTFLGLLTRLNVMTPHPGWRTTAPKWTMWATVNCIFCLKASVEDPVVARPIFEGSARTLAWHYMFSALRLQRNIIKWGFLFFTDDCATYVCVCWDLGEQGKVVVRGKASFNLILARSGMNKLPLHLLGQTRNKLRTHSGPLYYL